MRTTHERRSFRPLRLRSALAASLVAAMLAVPHPARAQDAADRYATALAREDAARAAAPVALDEIRATAKAYEAIVRRYPISGYADNALWQAGGLYALAYEKSGTASDRGAAERVWTWLQKEYPASSLAKKVPAQLAMLPALPPGATPASSAAPPTPTPPTPAPPTPSAASTDAGPQAAPGASIKNISKTTLPNGERVTIEFSKEVAYTGDRVDGPDRVFFDFVNASVTTAIIERAQSLTGTLIKGMRIGRHAAGVTRIVFELGNSPRYSVFPLYDPFRLVVDVETSQPALAPRPTVDTALANVPARIAMPTTARLDTPSTTLAAPAPSAPATPPGASTPSSTPVVSSAPPSATRNGDYSLARQLGLGVSRIVIDAGHGGHDPGAQANGIDESELVLDVAQRLQRLLTAVPGFEVVLTRSTDEFIPLEERTAIANRADADLFLSIHANSSRTATARGIETYFLSFALTPNAEAVAARENATGGQNMANLPNLVKAISLNSKLEESREFAALVQTSLVRKLRVQDKMIRDLGVKQAPFVVLIGANIPSVLAEISFLSNKTDSALLKQSGYRQKIAQALCDAIVKYQGSLKKNAVVASRHPEK